MSIKIEKYDVEELRGKFYYCPDSPTGLRRKTDWLVGFGKTVCKGRSGDVAGTTMTNGYYTVHCGKGGMLAVHVVIWVLVNGEIPEGLFIDHVDGNRSNNHIDNLRAVDHKVNGRNQKMTVRNRSGVTGVRFERRKCGWQGWVAFWNDLDGKQRSKYYGIERHGNDEAFRLACEFRYRKIEELNLQGAGYSERHGI